MPLHGEYEKALRVILKTVRGDHQSECWTIRKYLNALGVYNDDLGSSDRLIEALCDAVLHRKDRDATER